jgi:UDP-N-acetylglucosamine--N-acetylmuramyl-(pentapeptide) pyrophosphoryl-undecaprenol N-acetylglucosamine transferase
MRILFVGGGTGGHFYPLMAVAEVLRQESSRPELYYMGPDPYDRQALTDNEIKFISCPAGKLRIYPSIQNFFDLFRTFFGIFVAIWKLYVLYPDMVFSKGGYTSVPVLIAARFLRIPVVIHESDVVPGRANMLAKKYAKYIAVSYSEAAKYFDVARTALTGIPIRQAVLESPSDPFSVIGLPNDLPIIYVTGGSSGAERINNIILRCLDELLPNFRIFHQVGPNKKDEVILAAKTLLKNRELESRYFVTDLVDAKTVSALYSAASLIITRAGSTTLFEIALHGRPSIVIPIPEDISRDQRSNAYAYARTGAATVVEEHNLTETLLTSEIHTIMSDMEKWQSMAQAAIAFAPRDASTKIANVLLSIGKEHGS